MATTEDLESSGNIVKVDATPTFPVTRALCVGTAGTATLTSESGQTLTNFPLQAGYNPIKIKGITLGTASDVWALY